jgi:hypothetical protein
LAEANGNELRNTRQIIAVPFKGRDKNEMELRALAQTTPLMTI